MAEMEQKMEGDGWWKDTKKAVKKKGKAVIKNDIVPLAVTTVAGPVAGMATKFVLQRLKKRPAGVMPPSVRSFLEKKGDEKITSVEVIRTPLDAVSQGALAAVTLGTFNKAVQEAGYDAAFHLAMIVNGKYQIDKQEVIKVSQPQKSKKTETLVLKETTDKTIREMFTAAQQLMGDGKFTGYDAKTNNCQDFIMAMLQGADIASERAQLFVKQDAGAIFSKLPGFTQPVARAVTDMAAAANAAIFGQGAIDIIQQGHGIKKLYKKKKKSVKKSATDTYKDVKETGEKKYEQGKDFAKTTGKDAGIAAAKLAAKKIGKGAVLVWDELHPIRHVLAQGADALANQLNKTNIDALEKAGAKIHSFVHASPTDLARLLGKTIRVASKGAIITGQVTSVIGNVMVIAGTVTGQPEIVALGIAVDEAGTAIELTGRVGVEAGTITVALVQGDKEKAKEAALRAAITRGKGVLDMVTDGVGSTIVDLVQAVASDDPEATRRAAAKGALLAMGKATGTDDAAAVANLGVKVAGMGRKRKHRDPMSRLGSKATADWRHYLNDGEVKRAASNQAAMREVRVNPTNIASAHIEPHSALVYRRLGMLPSEFASRPTVRGFGANYVKTGYRDAPTGECAVGDTRSKSKSLSALPPPNYRDTVFDGAMATHLENSVRVYEASRDEKLTDLNVVVPYQKRMRSKNYVPVM